MNKIPGLEDFDIPEGMILNARTVALLEHLKTRDVVVWEGDDSPEDFETLRQMILIGECSDFRVIMLRSQSVHQMTDSMVGSGKFMVCNEEVT